MEGGIVEDTLKDLIRMSSRPDVLSAGERAVFVSEKNHNVRFRKPIAIATLLDRNWRSFVVRTRIG